MEVSTKSAVGFGWETFKKRPWFFVGSNLVIALAYLAAGGISSGINSAVTGAVDQPTPVGSVVNLLLTTLISMGATAFYLKAHDDPDAVSLSSLWHPQPFWKYLGASILLALVVAVGFLLLVVPGIIFTLMFMFTTFIVIDRELGPIEALKESRRITHGYKWQLLGFSLALVLVNLLGILALVIGLLVSIPVSSLAFAHAYRTLGPRAAPDAAMAAAAQ
jgi:uncharacterized membrane protein